MSQPTFSESDDAGEVRFVASRGAGDVFSAALRFVGAEARTLAPVVLAIAGPLVLAAAALRVIGGTGGGDTLASLADLGVNVVLTSAVFAYVRSYRAGTLGAAEVADVWDETKTLLGPLAVAIGALLLVMLALMIPVALLFGTLFLANPAVATIAGGLLLIALMLTVAPRLALALVAAGLDGLGLTEAFQRASALAHGERSLVLGTFALLFVATMVVLTVVVGGLAASLGVDRMAEPGVGSALATALVSVATLPVSVVFTVTWVVLYGSLVARAEGGDRHDEADASARPDAATETPDAPERPGDALARRLGDDRPADSEARL